jgi:hypothetical protein
MRRRADSASGTRPSRRVLRRTVGLRRRGGTAAATKTDDDAGSSARKTDGSGVARTHRHPLHPEPEVPDGARAAHRPAAPLPADGWRQRVGRQSAWATLRSCDSSISASPSPATWFSSEVRAGYQRTAGEPGLLAWCRAGRRADDRMVRTAPVGSWEGHERGRSGASWNLVLRRT